MGREERLRSLMIASQAGDSAAYRSLLSELSDVLRGYFSRRLARQAAEVDDLVQEVLLAVHAKRATYDPGSPFTAWAYAIARYKLADHWRRERSRGALPIDDVEALFAPDPWPGVEAGLDTGRLLGGVTPMTAGLIREVKIDGGSVASAAARTGLSETAVKVRIHRGLKALSAHVRGRSRP